MPTREEMRAALNIAPPTADEDFDLALDMFPPRVVNGVIVPSRPRPTLKNLDRILRGDPMFAKTVRYSELEQNIMVNDKSISDLDVTEIRLQIAERHDVEFDKNGDLDRDSFLTEVKGGKQEVVATIPPLSKK